MDKKERLKFFDKELSLIRDTNVKKLTKECLKSADDWFFTEPASSSGKYHPDFALEVHGLAYHTKAVVYFLCEIIRSGLYDIDEFHQDLLILSAICHDIKKYGDNNVGHTLKNHPELGSSFVEKVNKENKNILSNKDLKYVQECIKKHMGIFGDDVPKTDDEKILHLADLIASRREISLEFEKTSNKSTMKIIDEYVVDFGKYNGKNIKEVPIDYLKWAVENIKEKKVFKSLAKEILKEHKKNESNKQN